MWPARATAFLPSRNGFHFRNAFADEPVVTVLRRWRIGRAGNGLCGGMVFAARDFFEAGRAVPPDEGPPEAGSRLYRYVVRRLIAAFNLPTGVIRYGCWMLLSDDAVRARTWHTQWPRVRTVIDEGHPCPMGIVTVRGRNPAQMRHNHVVLAYAYSCDEGSLTIRVYDPNIGPADDVRIEMSRTAITSNIDVGHRVRGFFPLRYRPRTMATRTW